MKPAEAIHRMAITQLYRKRTFWGRYLMDNYLKKEFYDLIKHDEGFFDFIQQTALDGTWYWNLESKEDIWIDKRFWKVLGYSPEKIPTHNHAWKKMFSPEQLKDILMNLLKDNKQSGSCNPIKFKHQNGSALWMQCRTNYITDKHNNPSRLLITFYDITELKEREIKYKELINSISDSIYVIDKNWNYLMVNDAAEEHTGMPKEKINHSNLTQLFPRLENTDFFALFKKVMHKRTPGSIISSYKLPNGITKWYDVRAYPVDEGILCISKDITERKEAEIALLENKKRYELLINSSTDIIVELTAEGEQKYISPIVEKYTGYKPHELKRSFTEVIHPDDVDRVKEHWQEIINNPEHIHRDTYRHIHKTKGYVWFEASLKSYLDDPNIQSIICSVRDISDRKKAEEKLRQSDERHKMLSKAATEMIALESLEEIYTYVTDTLSREYPNAICLFVTADEKHNSTRVTNIKGLEDTLLRKVITIGKMNIKGMEFNLLPGHYIKYKTGKVTLFEGGLAQFAGSEFPSVAARSVEKLLGIHKIYAIGINKGENLYAVLHFFMRNKADLSNHFFIETFLKQAGIVIERKIMEKQLKESEKRLSEANATKDKFFSIIAHDLRNPFSLMLGFSEMNMEHLEQKEYDKAKQAGKFIRQSAEQGYTLLNNLLEWSQSQRGLLDFKPEYMELSRRVRKVTSLLTSMAEEKQINLKTDFDPEIIIYADPNMFDTILRNLLSNAYKYANPGGNVMVQAKQTPREIKIWVSDDGIGITTENISTLFSKVNHNTTKGTKGEKGSGLGLILCKEFIEKHGGNIGVETEFGNGTTIWFTLPNKDGEFLNPDKRNNLNTNEQQLFKED